MTTGSSCENEGDFDKLSPRNLLKCKAKKETNLSDVCKSLIIEGIKEMGGWVGGSILYSFYYLE